MRGHSTPLVLVLAVGVIATPSLGHAQPASTALRARAAIDVDAPRLTVAAALAVGLGVALSVGDRDPTPLWGGNPFDDGVRDGLRLRDPDARHAIALSSDVLVAGLLAYAALVDGLAIPLTQGDPDRAWRATAAFALVIGLTLSLDELVKHVAARSRPLEPGCDATPTPAHCTAHSPGMSFYSGHSATAFASAGFSCAMHLGHALYADAGTDGATCGATLVAAATIGIFRVMADQHYLTDVLVGAVIGFATGYLVPLLLVPGRPSISERAAAPQPTVVVLPTAALGGAGLESLGLSGLGTF